MFVKIVNDGKEAELIASGSIAQESIYQCTRVFVRRLVDDGKLGEKVLIEMEHGSNNPESITREVIPGHEQVYLLNDQGKTFDVYRW